MIWQRLIDDWKHHGGPGPGSRLLLAVSGGADSRLLLELVCRMRADWGFTLQALHVDHGVRSRACRCREQQILAASCRALGLELTVIPAGPGRSDEASLRERRYRLLENSARVWSADAVLTAHQASDLRETFFLRLFRGCSPSGLCGIPRRRGIFFRPLLSVEGDEIRHWLRGQDISWYEDPSNEDLRYGRNRLRRILPRLEESFPGSARAVLGLIGRLRLDEEYFAARVAEIRAGGIPAAGGQLFAASLLDALPSALRSRLLLSLLHDEGGHTDSAGVARMQALLRPGCRSGRQYFGRLMAERSGSWFWLGIPPGGDCGQGEWTGSGVLELPGNLRVERADGSSLPLRYRPFRPGETLPAADGRHRRSKTLLSAAGVPRILRPFLPVLESSDGRFVAFGPLLAAPDSPSLRWSAPWLKKLLSGPV